MESKLREKIRYNGRILDFHVDEVELPNGKTSLREIVDHKNAVAILVRRGENFVFVKQYRYAIDEEILEIPAGLLESGETPEVAAERELQEEIGLKPLKLHWYANVYPSPGFTDEMTSLYYADEFTESKLEPDDDEFIKIVYLPIEKVKEMYLKGEFEDAKTVCALGYYFSCN